MFKLKRGSSGLVSLNDLQAELKSMKLENRDTMFIKACRKLAIKHGLKVRIELDDATILTAEGVEDHDALSAYFYHK